MLMIQSHYDNPNGAPVLFFERTPAANGTNTPTVPDTTVRNALLTYASIACAFVVLIQFVKAMNSFV